MTVVLIVAGVLLIAGLWLAGTYNALVRTRNACDESWSDVDTELQRRYRLVPNLVETVRAYADHERETLAAVVTARDTAAANHGSPASQARDENQLIAGLNRLIAVSEAYPELKANTNFLHLQEELANTEDRIQRARRFYNSNVRDLANRIEVFPSNIVAGAFGFGAREYFEIDEPAAREVPRVGDAG